MELISGRMLDESIWHTLNGMTLFGSTAQGNVVDMMDQLGFYTGVNEYLYEGATPFTNNLMSMKYQIYRPYDTKYTEFSLKKVLEMSRFIKILIEQHLPIRWMTWYKLGIMKIIIHFMYKMIWQRVHLMLMSCFIWSKQLSRN